MTGSTTDRPAGYKLIEQGTLVNFDIVDTASGESVGGKQGTALIELAAMHHCERSDRRRRGGSYR